MENLFVYGFLKRGGPMEGYLTHEEYVGEDSVEGRLTRRHGLMTLLPGADQVPGELYRIRPELLPALDRAEGHPHLYERRMTALTSGELAWVYFFNTDNN